MTEPHKESHEESPKESPGTNPNSHDDSDVETPAVGDLRGEDVDALRAVVRDILQAVEESEGSDEDNGDENDAAASFTGSMALHSTSPKVKSPGTGAESSAYGPLPSDPARLSTQHPQVPPAFPSSSSGPISSPSTGPHLTTPPFPNPSAATMPRQNQSQGAGSKAGAAKAKADGSDLLERHNKIIAQILTRFRNMVMAATEPIPGGATIEHAALNRMTMETETAALVSKQLTQLTTALPPTHPLPPTLLSTAPLLHKLLDISPPLSTHLTYPRVHAPIRAPARRRWWLIRDLPGPPPVNPPKDYNNNK